MSNVSRLLAGTAALIALLWGAATVEAQVVGACCRGANCTMETQLACTSEGGTYLGDNVECIDGTCRVNPDFGVTDLTACWQANGTIQFRFSLTYGTGNVDPPLADVPVRITFVAPSGTETDDQVARWTAQPTGTCGDNLPPNCTGTCPDWTARLKNEDHTVTSACEDRFIEDAAGDLYRGCVCIYRLPTGKNKSAPDGPEAPYSFTVTVNGDGSVPERDPSNNSATINVTPSTPVCAGLPATSPFGARVVLAAIVVAGVVVLLTRVRRTRAA